MPQTKVNTPDGKSITVNHPEGADEQAILQFAAQQYKPPKPRSEQNFFERFGEDLKTRFGEQGAEIINARVAGDQGFASTALQLTGKVGAGTIMDFLGEALVSGGRGLSNITPDVIEDPLKEGATKVGYMLLDTELGQKGLNAAMEGMEAYQEFAEEHPVMARNIESVANIGLLVAPVKAKAKTPTQGKVGEAGEAVIKSGIKSGRARRRAFAEDLVRTPQTKKVQEAQALGQTVETGGLLRGRRVEATAFERDMAKEVASLRGVSTNKTLQGNLNVIRDAATAEAKRLQNSLAKAPNQRYFFGELKQELNAARAEITNTITGDAGKIAKDLINEFEKIARSKKPQLSELLRARKELDGWIAKQKPNAFDPVTENALSLATRSVRQTTNNFINARAPTAGVRRSLDKQWRLFSAAENLSTRAAKEGSNAIQRTMQTLIKILPFRSEFNNIMAAGFGVGGLGAAAMFAPIFTKLAIGSGAAYIGGKAIMHPRTRIAFGQILRMVDQGIKRTTDPALIRQLRADRAAIVELMKSAEKEEQ